jgi:hypothetical protein
MAPVTLSSHQTFSGYPLFGSPHLYDVRSGRGAGYPDFRLAHREEHPHDRHTRTSDHRGACRHR